MHPAWPLQIPHGILLASETYLKHDCLDKSESNLFQVSAYCSNGGAGEGKKRERENLEITVCLTKNAITGAGADFHVDHKLCKNHCASPPNWKKIKPTLANQEAYKSKL